MLKSGAAFKPSLSRSSLAKTPLAALLDADLAHCSPEGIRPSIDGVSQDVVHGVVEWQPPDDVSPATNADLRQMAVQNRDQVAAKMTPDQIAEAQRMASEWKPK